MQLMDVYIKCLDLMEEVKKELDSKSFFNLIKDKNYLNLFR